MSERYSKLPLRSLLLRNSSRTDAYYAPNPNKLHSIRNYTHTAVDKSVGNIARATSAFWENVILKCFTVGMIVKRAIV